MSNLLAEEREDLMIIGWTLRELSVELHSTNTSDEIDENLKDDMLKAAKDHIDGLEQMLTEGNIDASSLWESYFDIETKMKTYILPSLERSTYTGTPEFSKKFAIMALEHFNSNRHLVTNPNSVLVEGIARDIGRTVDQHGGKEALVVYMVLKEFYHCHIYLLHEISNGIADYKRINTYLDDIYKMNLLIKNDNQKELFKCSNSILGRLGSDFRKCYFNYLELVYPKHKKEIVLPDAAKEKIGEILTKSLEEKLK